jgi:hypothetical protein
MLNGPDYQIAGIVLLDGIKKDGTSNGTETVYWYDESRNTHAVNSYGKYLFQNARVEVVPPEDWPTSYPSIINAGATGYDPSNALSSDGGHAVFEGPFKGDGNLGGGLTELTFSEFPSGEGGAATTRTLEMATNIVSAYTIGSAANIEDEGVAHYVLNNMHLAYDAGVWPMESCMHDYSWNRMTMVNTSSNLYHDFSGYIR